MQRSARPISKSTAARNNMADAREEIEPELKRRLDLQAVNLVNCLKKAPRQRSLCDITIISDFMRQHGVFASGQDATEYERLLKSLASCCVMVECLEDQFVFQQGSKGEFFYILVQGQARLVLGQEESQLPELEKVIKETGLNKFSDANVDLFNQRMKKEKQSKRKNSKFVGEEKTELKETIQEKVNKQEENQVKQPMVKILNEGQSFGEMAMIVDDSKRSCGVKAVTHCRLAVIHRTQYNKIFRNFG